MQHDSDLELMQGQNGPLMHKPKQVVVKQPQYEEVEDEEDEEDKPKKKGFMAKAWLVAQETGMVKVTVWTILTIIMSVVGGWLFAAVEGPNHEMIRKEKYQAANERLRLRELYLQRVVERVMSLDTNASITPTIKPEAVRRAFEHYEKLMDIDTSDPKLEQDPWRMLNSIFFSCSLFTTIGFGGRNFPLTTAGRICTMIYSTITIPILLTMTGDLGLVVFEGIYWVWWKIKMFKKARKARPHKPEPEPEPLPEPSMEGEEISEMPTQTAVELVEEEEEVAPPKPQKRKKIVTSENKALMEQQEATFPVSLGLLMSLMSLLFCSGIVQLYEPKWNFFDANYYFVTSFLTIGLGDISPSAPKDGPESTLIPHIVLMIFSMTFIGLSSHVLSKRIELSYAMIAHGIHMEFRSRQVDPAITPMKDNATTVSESAEIDNLARKLGFFDRFYYGAMDNSRKRLLLDMWHRKANMKNEEIQVNLPKRDIGLQHLAEVDDITPIGDWVTEDFGLPVKIPEPENPFIKYLYNLD